MICYHATQIIETFHILQLLSVIIGTGGPFLPWPATQGHLRIAQCELLFFLF
jgi:hypothetical protein